MHLHPYTLIYAILLLFLLQSSNGIHKEGFNPNSLKYFHCCLLLPDLGLINHLSCLMCGSRIYQELAKFNRRNSFLEKWVRCHANYQSQMEAQPPVAKWVLLGRPYGLPIANHQVTYQMICQKWLQERTGLCLFVGKIVWEPSVHRTPENLVTEWGMARRQSPMHLGSTAFHPSIP